MNPVVIIEGPDGAGKTTLCQHLVKRGFKYFHEGPPPPEGDMLEYYAVKLWKAMHGRAPVVFDRFHLGEMIYGPIARNVDRVGYYGMRMFRRVFRSHNVLCTVATPPFATCYANWKKKFEAGDDYLRDQHKFTDCYHRFVGLQAYHRRFDYTEHTCQEWYDNYFASEESPMAQDPFPAWSIGCPRAKFLIVGERTNGTETDFPFFNSKNSSRFLNEALWEAGYHEDEMMFTNTFSKKGRPRDLRQTIDRMPDLRVALAFGEQAQEACRLADIPFVSLTHPACFFRFHQKRRPEFVNKLREVREFKWK